MSGQKESRPRRLLTWNVRVILLRLILSFTAINFSPVESFLPYPPSWPKPLRINTPNRARTNVSLHASSSADASSSWHILPDFAASNAETDSILCSCDAIVTTLSMNDKSRRPHRWMRSLDEFTSTQIRYYMSDEQSSLGKSTYPPKEAVAAIEATHRWASKFVRPLHLCPWAGSSLDTKGAIRYWVLLVDSNVNQGSSVEGVERIVREAGRQLELITNETPTHMLKSIDASVAISFVILVPTKSNGFATSPTIPFESFHDCFFDLEDRLLDECDEYWDSMDDNNDNKNSEAMIPDGCKFTIAAFHPLWKFNNEDDPETDENKDFEKRTPYPTISIVMSSAIDALVEKDSRQQENNASSVVTERIAALNEKTLRKIGLEKLMSMFETDVVCPTSEFKLDD
ncbi:hypothetical protein ACHAWX_005710 [Stephanocyclus meneghinianus]